MSKVMISVQKKDLEAVKKFLQERNKPPPKPIKRWEPLDKRTVESIEIILKAAERLRKDAKKLLLKVNFELRKLEDIDNDELNKADDKWLEKEIIKLEEYEMALSSAAME